MILLLYSRLMYAREKNRAERAEMIETAWSDKRRRTGRLRTLTSSLHRGPTRQYREVKLQNAMSPARHREKTFQEQASYFSPKITRKTGETNAQTKEGAPPPLREGYLSAGGEEARGKERGGQEQLQEHLTGRSFTAGLKSGPSTSSGVIGPLRGEAASLATECTNDRPGDRTVSRTC